MSERLERGTDKGKSTSLAENAPLISKLFRIEIAGVENLEQIPPDKHPIYVTTHLSNYDSPIALSALSNAGVKNLKLAEAAAHERIDRNPIGYLQRRFLVGSENSFNISSIRGRTQDGTNLFNPDDFEPMIEALYKGSGIAVSAYFDPTYKDKWRVPKRGGHAAAYLANIAENTLIVPIAVDIQSKEPLGAGDTGIKQIIKEGRPAARVIIGQPMEPNRIEGIEELGKLVKKLRSSEGPITEAEHKKFKQLTRALREESARIMQALSDLLPQEKRATGVIDEAERVKTRTYELERGLKVEIEWSRFSAENESAGSEERAVVILPGWGNTRLLSMQELSQAFANSSGSDAYLITTRLAQEESTQSPDTLDSLHEEARAIGKFIKERRLKEVTLTGHSAGADRAINVASVLQKDPELTVRGLVLMGPTGFYEQHPAALAFRHVTHTGIGIPREVRRKGSPEQKETVSKGGRDLFWTALDEIGRYGLGPQHVRKITSEIANMAKRNPRVAEIAVPVVLIVGAHDPVSSREKIVPRLEEEKMRKEMGEEPGRRKDLAARERILKEKFLLNCPNIRMIVPEKMGNHLVQILRPQSVAKVTTYFLDRYHRQHSRENPSSPQ